jgi:hypothetical protein
MARVCPNVLRNKSIGEGRRQPHYPLISFSFAKLTRHSAGATPMLSSITPLRIFPLGSRHLAVTAVRG